MVCQTCKSSPNALRDPTARLFTGLPVCTHGKAVEMSRFCHITRRLGATCGRAALLWAVVLGLVVFVTEGTVLAQDTPPPPPLAPQPAAAPSSVFQERVLAPADAMTAYRQMEGWLRGFSVPADAKDAVRVRGVCLSLRLGHVFVARECQMSESDTATGGLASAARGAIAGVKARFAAEPGAALDTLEGVGRGLVISLELAGALVPLNVDTYAKADATVSLGLEGVAARKGDRLLAIFPEEMLLNNDEPSDALARLASRLADDPSLAIKADPRVQPPQLDRLHGITFYRFGVTHLAQTRADAPPLFLRRLTREVRPQDVNISYILALGDTVADHLRTRLTKGGENAASTVPGVLRPSREDAKEIAALADQAIAAYALTRWAPISEPANDAQRDGIRAGVLAWYATIGAISAQTDPLTLAAVTLPTCELVALPSPGPGVPDDASPQARVEMLAKGLLACIDPQDPSAFHATIPQQHRGIIAFALARLSSVVPELVQRERVEPLIRSIYRDTPAGELVGQMPWLGWAELELSKGQPTVPAAQALRNMRDAVREHTLRAEDLDEQSSDLAGGVVFTVGPVPLPTAQSFRAAAIVATMAGDARLTPAGDRPLAIALSLSHVRFAAQLCWDGPSLAFSRNPGRDRGGVRAAPWDVRLSLDASAMSLFTLSETMRSIRAKSGE